MFRLPFRPCVYAPVVMAVLLLPLPSLAAAKDQVPDWVKAAMSEPLTGVSDTAKAVVLLDQTTLTVGPDGRAVEHRRRVVKILRPNGRDEGMVFVPFDNDTKLLSLHVWSVGPDGQQYQMKDKDIAEAGYSGSGNYYEDERYKYADPPGRDPGGVVAYEYEQRQAPYRNEADWFFQDDLPHLKQSYQIELPPGYTFSSSWAHHEPETPIDLEHGRTRWELATTPAIDLDRVPLSPSLLGLMGRMVLQYGPVTQTPALGTWQAVGDWFDKLARDRMVATPDIAAKSAELTAGKTDFYDKTEAIAEFVQKDIRYFVIEKGIGGDQPHPASDIFRNRYGDCKDKSTLLSAMLSSVGIHSILVLVDTHRGFVDPAAPSVYGNHAIAAVEIPANYNSPRLRSVVTSRTGKRYLIVDPTWEKTAFGQLEHGLQGGYGVLVEAGNGEVVQFPVLSPELNSVHRTAKLELQLDGSVKGNIVEQRFGDLSETPRYLYSTGDAREQADWLDDRLKRDFSSFHISDFKVENVAALNKPLTTSYSLTADRYGRTMGPLLMVRPRVMGEDGFELDHKTRKFPIDMRETMLDNDDFTITIPEGYAVDEIPDPVKLDVGFASYESATKLDGNALHYTRTYTVRDITVPADRYDDLKKLAATIEADEQNHAVFKKK